MTLLRMRYIKEEEIYIRSISLDEVTFKMGNNSRAMKDKRKEEVETCKF
jgi:hypothetical protein